MVEAEGNQIEAEVEAEVVNLSGTAIGTVEGEDVSISRGGARTFIANNVAI